MIIVCHGDVCCGKTCHPTLYTISTVQVHDSYKAVHDTEKTFAEELCENNLCKWHKH